MISYGLALSTANSLVVNEARLTQKLLSVGQPLIHINNKTPDCMDSY